MKQEKEVYVRQGQNILTGIFKVLYILNHSTFCIWVPSKHMQRLFIKYAIQGHTLVQWYSTWGTREDMSGIRTIKTINIQQAQSPH